MLTICVVYNNIPNVNILIMNIYLLCVKISQEVIYDWSEWYG